MGIKRPVDTTFWNDETVMDEFSPEDKYFMLYLLTNPHTKQLGVYKLPKKIIQFELGYSKEAVEVLLNRFENKYAKIKYNHKTQEISIFNYLKHSIIKGGKPVIDCIIKDMTQVKDKSLIESMYDIYIDFDDSREITKQLKEVINNYITTNDNDNDNDSIVDVSYDDSSTYRGTYREVIEYLNDKANTQYKPTSRKTQSLIKARLAENFTIDDFKQVIDNKVADWLKNDDMRKYLRPETLFGTKFESYLNTPQKPKSEIDWFDKYKSEKLR